MKLDLSEAKEYLDALKVAENFPSLFAYAQTNDADYLIDEAMDTIDRWCPHLWPVIDRQILRIVENTMVMPS